MARWADISDIRNIRRDHDVGAGLSCNQKPQISRGDHHEQEVRLPGRSYEKKVSFDKLSDNAYAYTAEGDPNTGIIIGDDAVW